MHMIWSIHIVWYCIWYQIWYYGQYFIALRHHPDISSGLASSLPSLCCPGPALADTLAPDPLSFCDGHHLGAAPAVAPHPDVHLVEPGPAAVAPVPLRVGGGASKTLIVLEAVWNRGVTVAADKIRNEGGAPQHVRDRADVEAGQARVAGRVIKQHGHSSLLHDAVQSQIDGLKRAEAHEGHLLVGCTVPYPLAPVGTNHHTRYSWSTWRYVEDAHTNAAIACIRALCRGMIGCCKGKSGHAVRIGIQWYMYDIVYDIILIHDIIYDIMHDIVYDNMIPDIIHDIIYNIMYCLVTLRKDRDYLWFFWRTLCLAPVMYIIANSWLDGLIFSKNNSCKVKKILAI